MMGECQSFWQDVAYVSKTECQSASNQAVQYLSGLYPNSDGEIYCLTDAEFEDWKNNMNQGIEPRLRPDHPYYQQVEPQGTDA